jgi:hypothetical protein
MDVRLLASRDGHPLAPRRFLVLISVRGWVDSKAIVRLEGLGKLRNWMTTSRIKPSTFRLVAYSTDYVTVWSQCIYIDRVSPLSWVTVSLYSNFFTSIWRMQTIWSVVDLISRKLHWLSPITCFPSPLLLRPLLAYCTSTGWWWMMMSVVYTTWPGLEPGPQRWEAATNCLTYGKASPIALSVHPSICLTIYQSNYLPTYLFIYVSISLSVCLSVYP